MTNLDPTLPLPDSTSVPQPTPALNHECHYNALTFWLWGVAGNALCATGLVGNALTLFVLTRMTPKTSVILFIGAVCVSDTIVLFFSTVTVLSNAAFGYMERNRDYVNNINKGYAAFYYLSEVFRYFNTYMTVALCVDRYISVCHTQKAQDMNTKKRAAIVITAIFVIDAVFNIPKMFEYTWEMDDPLVSDCVVTNETELADSDSYRTVYLMLFDGLLGFILPFFTMLVLTILTILTLRKSSFQGLAEQQRKRTLRATTRVTWMCVAVVIVYLVCQLPVVAIYISIAFSDDFIATPQGHALHRVSVFLILVNSSVNFVIYCLISPNFRKVFVKVVVCECMQYRPVALDEASQSGVTIRSRLSRTLSRNSSLEKNRPVLLNRRPQGTTAETDAGETEKPLTADDTPLTVINENGHFLPEKKEREEEEEEEGKKEGVWRKETTV